MVTESTIPHFSSLKKPVLEPGILRNASHFIAVMERLIEILKTKLKTTHLTVELIKSFTESIRDLTYIDQKTLAFVLQRMGIVNQSLEIEDDEMYKLLSIAIIGTTLGIYSRGL